ncbi:sensor domain-containing diguanylate cyclase [Thiorhodococcus fuscus]|uniref:diguanylate cyclase n=1 Tax=Thiorhodococcus fuscus TaxID=527200 RepID=A0ABW4Y7S1_9GAMM
MSYRTVVFLASVLLLGSFAAIARLVDTLAEQRLSADLDREAVRLKTAFGVMRVELEHGMISIADLLASDTEIRGLVADGAAAVRAEGGGRGGAEAERIRRALAHRLAPQWKTMREEIGLQQIHFHLAPEAVSFLRMSAPGAFGDSLRDKRRLIVDVQRDGRRRAGFEIGPSFAGIRSVVPVVAPESDPGRASAMIGTLEVGASFPEHLRRLSVQVGVGYGVLLKHEAISGLLSVNRQSARIPAEDDGDYLLAASRDELKTWLSRSLLPAYNDADQNTRLDWNGRIYQVVRFPLHRYQRCTDPPSPPVGSIVIWSDISDQVEALAHSLARVNRFALIGYLGVQLLLLGLVRFSRREWQRQLDAQTAELRCKEARLMELATTDPLTGLLNRRRFFERLTDQLARLDRLGERCSLLMIDLDHFKRVNDSYGHAAGDAVLQRFADHCRQLLRQTDSVGRIGGEEFAVLLPGEDLGHARSVAERLRALVADDAVETERGAVRVTISLGVTELASTDGPDTALGRADEALYAAKEGGRNRVILSEP